MKDPVTIQITTARSPRPGSATPLPGVGDRKTPLLLEILKRTSAGSVLARRTRRRAERLAYTLQHAGLRVARIHSDRSQAQRVQALEGFRSGRYQILVATDIAARGLDVENITHVINYDIPHTREEYVHRSGRTARAEAEGDAFTLVAPEEEVILRTIEKEMGHPLPRVVLPDFDYGRVPPLMKPPEPAKKVFGTRTYGGRRRR